MKSVVTEEKEDGKADPKELKGDLKRLRLKRTGFCYTSAHMGMLTAMPQIQYNLFNYESYYGFKSILYGDSF